MRLPCRKPAISSAEPITGSGNTPIGAFINYLQSSNWVKQGVELYPLGKKADAPTVREPYPQNSKLR